MRTLILLLTLAIPAIAQPLDPAGLPVPGPRVQLANMIPGSDAIDLGQTPGGEPLLATDTMGTESDLMTLAPEMRRIVISVTVTGVRSVVLDTTLADADTSWYYILGYRDAATRPCAYLLRRDRTPPPAGRERMRVLHLGSDSVALAVRVEGDVDHRIEEIAAMRAGDLSGYRSILHQSLRLRVARPGDSGASSFIPEMRRPDSVTGVGSAGVTLVLTGSLARGDLRAWRVDEGATRTTGHLWQLERAPTRRGVRVVNLSDSAISVRTQWMTVDHLNPGNATPLDDDVTKDSIVRILGLWSISGSRAQHDPGTTQTIVGLRTGWHHTPPIDVAGAPVHPDSVSVRFVNASSQTWMWIYPPGEPRWLLSPPTTTARITFRAGFHRFDIGRFFLRSRADTSFAKLSVALQGGAAVTLFVNLDTLNQSVRLLVDSDPSAQSLTPLDALGPWTYQPPAPPPGRGVIEVVNATMIPMCMMAADSLLSLPPRAYGMSARLVAGLRTTPIAFGVDCTVPSLTVDYRVGSDSTTTLVLVGTPPEHPYRALVFYSPMMIDTTRPTLRIINAMRDVDPFDINAIPAPYEVPERRMWPDESIEHRGAILGPLALEISNRLGTLLFRALDTLTAVHRYTAVLTGTLRSPRVYLVDEDGPSADLDPFTIEWPGVSSVEDGDDRGDAIVRERISPNPAMTTIEIANDRRVTTLILVDALGRTLLSIAGNPGWLDISKLPAGAYTLVAHGTTGPLWRERLTIVK